MSVKTQIVDTFNTVKETAMNINEKAVVVSEEILNEVIEGGEQWQELGKTAIDGSVQLVGQQQDLFLTAFETVKTQLTVSSERLKNIVSAKAN
ncbi:MAG: hypothetical protein ACPGVB_08865 [Chitinophagales bacterium]